jgi:DNA integrity scanning protein DisA with diadenylate cyclase activity
MTTTLFDAVTSQLPGCPAAVLEPALELAVEIAREGREGRRIGTLFTVGRAEAVLAASRALILDPLAGHPEALRHITDANLRGTLKELAQLDGAFVVDDHGVVRAACRYLDASSQEVDLPLGLGSRHLAAASVSRRLGVIAIVVSESAVVRVFHNGALVAEILPELWVLSRYQSQLRGHVTAQQHENVAILTADPRAVPPSALK